MNLTFRYRENAGEAIEPSKVASVSVSDDEGGFSSKPKGGFAGFASFADTGNVEAFEDEEEEAGGLMARILLKFLACAGAHDGISSPCLRRTKTRRKRRKRRRRPKRVVLIYRPRISRMRGTPQLFLNKPSRLLLKILLMRNGAR